MLTDMVSSLKMESEDSDEDTFKNNELASFFASQFELQGESTAATENTYVLHMCGGTKSSSKIAVGLSDYSCAIYDSGNLTKQATALGHQKTLSGLRFSPKNDHLLYSCSMDGTVKLWDLRTDLKKCKTEYSDDTSDSNVFKPLTTFDVSPNDRFLCAGSELVDSDAYLLFWDVRSTKLLGGYWESHTDDITHVCFDPSKQNTMATGSTDGLINIFDISKSCEDDALDYCLNTESSVAKIVWLLDDYSLACITHTEDLQLWKTDGAAPEVQFSRQSIAECMQRKSADHCYLVNLHLKKGSAQSMLLAGSTSKNGQCLRSLEVTSQELKPLCQFLNNRQIVRTSWYLENDERLITGGEDGVVNVWKPVSVTNGNGNMVLPLKPSSMKMPSKFKQHKELVKPYQV